MHMRLALLDSALPEIDTISVLSAVSDQQSGQQIGIMAFLLNGER